MPNAVEALRQVPLFAELSGRQLRKVAQMTAEHRCDAGDVVVREGGRTGTLFVILEGEATVVREERTIARLGAGEFFGELSMIDGRPRVASVVAETPLECLVLRHDDLRKLVQGDPRMAWSLVHTLASRLRSTV
jgi:CRP-like cAMP-binding protein